MSTSEFRAWQKPAQLTRRDRSIPPDSFDELLISPTVAFRNMTFSAVQKFINSEHLLVDRSTTYMLIILQ